MNKKEFRRINLRVDPALYNQIKELADNSYLRISTFTRQLIQKSIKNYSNKNLML
jgi:hypothetical protein